MAGKADANPLRSSGLSSICAKLVWPRDLRGGDEKLRSERQRPSDEAERPGQHIDSV